MLIFVVGSIICAAAPNSIALILGRAIAGVGASGLMSGAVLIIAQSAPLEKRPGLLGVVTGIFGISSIAGPFIGGALTERSTWRWCFGINAPIGAVTMAIVAVCVKKIDHSDDTSKRPAGSTLTQKIKQFDLVGMVVVLASLVCLILALQLGGSESSWNSGRVIALFVVAGVLFLAFLAMEKWLSKSRTIPSTIVHSRSMWAAALFAACTAAAMFVAVTYLPIYFQALRGSSALRSGVMLTPLILGFVVMSVFAGILTNMVGYSNPAMIVGAVLSSVGSGLLTTFALNTPSSKWIGYQVLFGFGIGFGLQQPMLVVQTVLPPEDIPIGVSLITLSQMVSGSIFVSVSQSIFQNTIVGIHNVYPNISVDTLLTTGATNIPALFSDDQLLRVLPIYRNAIVNTFYVALALSCLSILGALGTEWKSMKTKAVGAEVEH
jgi:MFS family permease